eukprot:TRINITY_DN30007_c0_g1_i1.p2 TRINITY_DN30007_c0_g1~~TRINITY_DN30007_c0_g1_i1.p2  ORF type:complete len:302 (-),score=8.27 TRINITY_DN30007_c0_g1_i1:1123-2028(-)
MSEFKSNDGGNNTIAGWDNIDFNEIEVGKKIGGGGIGVIHHGYFRNSPVAIKTLFNPRVTNEVKQEYMDELLVMSKLKHSNIVTFLGACMTPPNLCFVMELCDCSVFEMLHVNREYIDEREGLRIATDVGYAMEYLHSLKPVVIHRDLKTHNILRDQNGVYKICDFGLVMVKNAQAGTPAYMPPELLLNKSFNRAVDVYSFGIVFNEILTNEIPFTQLDVGEVRRRIIDGERPALPSLHGGSRPTRTVQLITKCWHQKPEQRPTFSYVVDELLAIAEEMPAQNATKNVGSNGGDALDDLLR